MSDRPPRLPKVSHLQYLALGLLRLRERPGREIRDEAGNFGVRRSAAAFY